MGFDPVSLIAEATATFGAGSAATGATAAAAGATVATGAADAAAAGLTSGIASSAGAALGTGAAAATTGAASAGLSASTLATLGASAALGALPAVLGPKPPKPGGGPQAPSLFGANKGALALLPKAVGDAGGTFLTGNNRAPQIAGGKKLLGQ